MLVDHAIPLDITLLPTLNELLKGYFVIELLKSTFVLLEFSLGSNSLEFSPSIMTKQNILGQVEYNPPKDEIK